MSQGGPVPMDQGVIVLDLWTCQTT